MMGELFYASLSECTSCCSDFRTTLTLRLAVFEEKMRLVYRRDAKRIQVVTEESVKTGLRTVNASSVHADSMDNSEHPVAIRLEKLERLNSR